MNWREINEAISRCRRSSNTVACLTALFERIRDGHVAAALGEEHERRGRIDDARRWFTEARRLYPKPEFKARALAALRRLGASEQPERSETAPAQGSVLHIIECSKRKVWDLAASTPRFVPAKQAYLGDAIRSWLADPRASTERWLILSARYGFIDPDQPIENYDVTFKLPSTGPIPDDALAAQVRYQVRWADAVPIRQFSRVVVHGHRDYFDRVRAAFSAVGAQVVGDGGQVESAGNDAASVPAPTTTRADRSDPTARPITTTRRSHGRLRGQTPSGSPLDSSRHKCLRTSTAANRSGLFSNALQPGRIGRSRVSPPCAWVSPTISSAQVPPPGTGRRS